MEVAQTTRRALTLRRVSILLSDSLKDAVKADVEIAELDVLAGVGQWLRPNTAILIELEVRRTPEKDA
jgi:hypothetical protein